MIPKIYVVERSQITTWRAKTYFTLTFDEASQLIHDLQDAMIDLRHVEHHTEREFFVLVNLIPE